MGRDVIPQGAKRVFKGQIFDVYQWEQKMFDGTVKIFEAIKRSNTAQVMAVVGNKILIEEQEQPNRTKFVSLPGGRLEEDEESLMGAKRELQEETGYESGDWTLWKQFDPAPKIVFEVFVYIARNCQKKTRQMLEAGEKITFRLVSFEELLEMTDDFDMFRQKDLAMVLMDMRLHKEKMEEFRKLLWP